MMKIELSEGTNIAVGIVFNCRKLFPQMMHQHEGINPQNCSIEW
jgi:hypothetical protein